MECQPEHNWKTMVKWGRQVSLEKEFHSFGAVTMKVLLNIATHLASDGRNTQRRALEGDWRDWVDSFEIG